MLTLFLIVFPAPFTPGVVRNFGRAELAPDIVGGGICDDDGARSPLFGIWLPSALTSETGEAFPVLFLVFVVGKAGNADVGGPYDGRDGRGIAAAMVTSNGQPD